jgi:hypothetical protein
VPGLVALTPGWVQGYLVWKQAAKENGHLSGGPTCCDQKLAALRLNCRG